MPGAYSAQTRAQGKTRQIVKLCAALMGAHPASSYEILHSGGGLRRNDRGERQT
jgi:hypothetical protein